MSGALGRTSAVLRADLRVRLRRPSTAVLLLAAALGATLLVPDPRSGRALLKVDGARALMTSETTSFATAALLPILLGLFGFYVVSRGVDRDRESGVGPLLATTPVRSSEYLLGKLLASAALLVTVAGGFLLASMAMQLVRGEGPLLPLVFLRDFALLGVPAALGVAAWALLFESVPGLSGRGGDVAYFFVWAVSIPLAVQLSPGPGGGARLGPGTFLDSSGLAWVVNETSAATGSGGFSIGASPADPAKGTIDFPGLVLSEGALLRRSASLALPVLLFVASLLLFRRFDPSRGGARTGTRRRSLLWLLDVVARAPARLLLGLLSRLSPDREARAPSFAGLVLAEVELTFRMRPAAVLLVLASAVVSLVAPLESVGRTLLPALFAGLAVVLSDVPVRHERDGTEGLVLTAPLVDARFVALRLATTLAAAGTLLVFPLARLLLGRPSSAAALLGGWLLAAALATLLGLATGTPKAFPAVFLALWYVALNDGGHAPALDFAGWYGTATPPVTAAWLGVGLALVPLAHLLRTLRARRRG